jgi:hypothetical protein
MRYKALRSKTISLFTILFGAGALLSPIFAFAQSPPVQMCNEPPTPAWCSAVRGDRSEGWVPQTRSESWHETAWLRLFSR